MANCLNCIESMVLGLPFLHGKAGSGHFQSHVGDPHTKSHNNAEKCYMCAESGRWKSWTWGKRMVRADHQQPMLAASNRETRRCGVERLNDRREQATQLADAHVPSAFLGDPC